MKNIRRTIFTLLVCISPGLLKTFAQCDVTADFSITVQNCTPGNRYHVVFTNLTTDINGQIDHYDWDFGDGSPVSHFVNPSHNYIAGTIYNATLVAFDTNGCSDTITLPVTIPALPTASFTFTPNNSCSGTNINFTFTGTGTGLTYNWNFGDGNTSNLQNPGHIFNATGCGTQNFIVTLTVTDASGCSSLPYNAIVTIKRQPDVLYYEPNGYRFCHADTSNISDTAKLFNVSTSPCISNYSINWGDGTPVQTAPPLAFDVTNSINHIFDDVGYYNLVVTAQGTNGCQTDFNQTVVIESNPVAALIGPPVGSNVGCAPLNICFTNISQNITPTTVMTVDWGDGNTEVIPNSSVGNLVCHTYSQSGCHNGAMTNYSITLTAQNSCDFSTTTWSPVRVYEPPQSDFIVVDDSVCINEPAVFRNITIPNTCAANSGTFYTWNFGDGTTYGPIYIPSGANPQQIVTHPYVSSGTYTVTLTATNSSTNGCGSSTFTANVFVSDAQAQFSFDTVCFRDPTHFTDLSTGYGGATVTGWQWNFGDGGSSTQQNPSHTYTSWGDFWARLIITTDFGCTDTIQHLIHVDTLPFVNFNYDTVCFGNPVHFTNLSYGRGSPLIGYQWYFGDGNSSTNTNPVHIYPAPGSYSVLLVVQAANGCIDSVRHTIIVSPPPIASFNNTIACLGSLTHFTSTSTTTFGNIVSWQWDFGDGVGNSTLQNPDYIFPGGGTFNVQLIVTTNIGCSDTIIRPVFVSPLPTAAFTAPSVCQGTGTSFSDMSSGNGTILTGWNWNFGDGNTSSTQNPTHIYGNAGDFSVHLTVTSQFGCQDDTIITVTVDSLPDASFIASTECIGMATTFTDASIAHGSAIVTWTWNFGDGTGDNTQNPIHQYANSGTYSVLLIVENADGCIDSIRQNINVSPQPLAEFNFNTACEGNNTFFTNGSTSTFGTIVNWDWSFGDGTGTSGQQNPTYLYPDSGNYQTTLVVTTSFGCKDTITHTVYVSPIPLADFTSPDVCFGTASTFTDLSSGFVTTVSNWNYSFGDGNSSTLQNPGHTYANPGSYNVSLQIHNQYGCTDDTTISIKIDSLPQPEFNFTNVCFHDTSVFSDNSIAHGSANVLYEWDFGDGQSGNGINVNNLYTGSGIYYVTLTVENINSCRASVTHPVNVFALPEAGFTFSSACFGSAVSFTDTSHANATILTSWDWNFGDASGTSTNQNPDYNYPSTGNYTVTLIIENINGCRDTASLPLQYMPTPEAEFSADTVCALTPTHFTNLTNNNGSTINSYQWNFGDGQSSGQSDPGNIYLTGGIYTATLIATSVSGCADTISKPVLVDTIPTVIFTADTVCFGDSTHFTDFSFSGSGTIFSWNYEFGDATTIVGIQDPVHLYPGAGTYNAILNVENSHNCFNSDTIQIIIHQLPVASFTHGNSCMLNNVAFSDNSLNGSGIINSWTWDFGDGIGTSHLQNPGYTYTSIDTVLVSLSVQDNFGCVSDTTDTLKIWPIPTVNFNADTVCFGNITSFTDLSNNPDFPINQWEWNFGDGNTGNTPNPQNLYSNAGVYNVDLIATNLSGCSDSITKAVRILYKPQAGFSSPAVCYFDTTHFADLSVAGEGIITSWNYEFGDGLNSTQENPAHYYTYDATYMATLIVTNSAGCNDTISQNVQVYTPPTAGFSYNMACVGAAVQFTDTSNTGSGIINSWSWNFGEPGGISSSTNPSYTFNNINTNQTVGLIVSDTHACSDTINVNISLYEQPVAHFNVNAACSGTLTQFTDSSYSLSGGTIQSWNWNFGDGYNSIIQSPGHIYDTVLTTTYINASLIAFDDHGCSDTVTSTVIVYPLPIPSFSASAACNTHQNIFTDNSHSAGGNIISWNWDFGDGSPSVALQNTTHIYGITGNTTQYPVTLTVTDINGCMLDSTKNVFVYPLPVVGFEHPSVCQGYILNFIDTSFSNGAPINSWIWNFGDGTGINGIINPGHQYPYQNDADTFNVSLIVADGNGCTDSITIPVNIFGQPNADFSGIAACSGFSSLFTDLSLPNTASINQWEWNFGDGIGTSNQQNPGYAYGTTTTVSTYNVELMIEDLNGCRDTISHNATIYPSPVAEFTSDTVCSGVVIPFTDNSTTISGTLQNWSWVFGDGSVGAVQNPVHLYPVVLNNTTYDVTLIVENSHGCRDTISHTALIHPNPVIQFNSNIACYGNATIFNNSSYSNGGNIVQWQWGLGDGSTSSTEDPQHIYPDHGYFNAQLNATDINGCHATFTQQVLVDSLPVPEFNYQLSCTNGIVSFANNSDGNGSNIVGYWWNFGDQNYSGQTNPSHYYSPYGQYDVSLTIYNDRGCRDSLHQILNIHPGIEWDFTASPVCLHEITYFNDFAVNQAVPAIAWNWSFGDGTFSTQEDPTHVYLSYGIYNVILTVTDANGCQYTLNHQIEVYPLPEADFTSNIVQIPNATQFTDQSATALGTIIAWQWNFGDGGTSSQQNPAHFYASPGFYQAILVVANLSGCKDTITQQVQVNGYTIAQFSNDTVCAGTPMHFIENSVTAVGTITQWYWDFGDGYASTQQNPTHVYYSSGNFQVTLTATNSNSISGSVTHNVVVLEAPLADFTSSAECVGNMTSLINNSTYNQYPVTAWIWDLSDGSTSNDPSFIHQFANAGQYPVQMIAINSIGCRDTIIKTVNVWALPQVNITAMPQEGCIPLEVEFTDHTIVSDGAPVSWQWNFGDGTSSVSAGGASHEYPLVGIFDVTVTVVSNHGCISTQNYPGFIQSYPNPIASFYYSPSNPNFSDPTIFFHNASFGASVWNWDFGDTESGISENPSHEYAAAGQYTVTLIAANVYGCADTTSKDIQFTVDGLEYFPNAMTPNGDGVNDFFIPNAIGWNSEDFEFMVFDRWGELMYRTTDINQPWNGKNWKSDKPVETGVYIWRVNVKDINGKKQRYIGRITVYY